MSQLEIYKELLIEAGNAGQVINAASAPASAYLAADIVTATPQRLQILLFDSAVRLCRRGLETIDCGAFDEASGLLKRAGEIIRHFREATEIEDNLELAGLLGEVYRRLAEAGFYRRREDIRAAIVQLDTRRDEIATHLRTMSNGKRQPVVPRQQCWIG